MTAENFCFYLQYRLIQTSQTGGQWYNDTSPFSIPWSNTLTCYESPYITAVKSFTGLDPGLHGRSAASPLIIEYWLCFGLLVAAA